MCEVTVVETEGAGAAAGDRTFVFNSRRNLILSVYVYYNIQLHFL
uniref:Uncharacterized protein n=1 Tax=Anguilla anguilla TaxID=7936 RepID=A0A0E9PIA9_ANGAN